MKKRVTYFDLAKGVGIILVVLGHMENISGELRTWISSFHMPLFFVISGMLLAMKGSVQECIDNREGNNKLWDLVAKTAKGLLIPYFWFSLLYIPIDIMNLQINHIDKHTFVQNILDSISFGGVSVMWFLPALFIAETVSIILIKKVSDLRIADSNENKILIKSLILYVITLVVSILVYGVWANIKILYDAYSSIFVFATILGFIRTVLRGICMSIHVVTGYLVYKLIISIENKYFNNIEKRIKGFSIAGGVILLVINMGLCLKNGAVDNHFLTLNNLCLYYICAFLGSISIILLCKGFDSIPFIDFLGKNSLIIMATHLQCYLLYAGILVALAIDVYVTRAKSYVYMFNSVLFTMLFEVVVIFIINTFFPFVLGKGSIKDIFKIFKKNKE